MYASPTWCTHAKKKKRDRSDRRSTCLAFDSGHSGAFIARAPPMCSPFLLAKGIVSRVDRFFFFFFFFCKRNAFLRVGKAAGARTFRIEKHANHPFRVRFCDCEVSNFNSFVGLNASTSTASGTASNLWSSHAWPDAFRRTSS